MTYIVVIPAHNEQELIKLTLDSLLTQTVLPKKIIVVDDNSSDATAQIVTQYSKTNPIIELISNTSSDEHLPGSKVIKAFNKGFETVDNDFDIIVKADADLIFPENYFEEIIKMFHKDNKIGIAGGFAYVEKNGNWILENLTDKEHVRGGFKAYRKSTFNKIGGLKPAMGWDTVDELLCRFYGWETATNVNLKVKHLKPTGANYNKTARYKQGSAFYVLGYGFAITFIASLKLAFRKKKPLLFIDYLVGYWKAKKSDIPKLVTKEQEKFIRQYRWKKMKEKLF